MGYKDDGRIVFNQPRALKPLADMPPKAYHLADFDAYERLCGRRWAIYTAAWRAPITAATAPTTASTAASGTRSPEQVGEELSDLAARYRLQLIWIVDDNFLVDRDRCVGIAEGICGAARFDWSIQASTNLVTRFSVEELEADAPRGLEQVAEGADTGSPKCCT